MTIVPLLNCNLSKIQLWGFQKQQQPKQMTTYRNDMQRNRNCDDMSLQFRCESWTPNLLDTPSHHAFGATQCRWPGGPTRTPLLLLSLFCLFCIKRIKLLGLLERHGVISGNLQHILFASPSMRFSQVLCSLRLRSHGDSILSCLVVVLLRSASMEFAPLSAFNAIVVCSNLRFDTIVQNSSVRAAVATQRCPSAALSWMSTVPLATVRLQRSVQLDCLHRSLCSHSSAVVEASLLAIQIHSHRG